MTITPDQLTNLLTNWHRGDPVPDVDLSFLSPTFTPPWLLPESEQPVRPKPKKKRLNSYTTTLSSGLLDALWYDHFWDGEQAQGHRLYVEGDGEPVAVLPPAPILAMQPPDAADERLAWALARDPLHTIGQMVELTMERVPYERIHYVYRPHICLHTSASIRVELPGVFSNDAMGHWAGAVLDMLEFEVDYIYAQPIPDALDLLQRSFEGDRRTLVAALYRTIRHSVRTHELTTALYQRVLVALTDFEVRWAHNFLYQPDRPNMMLATLCAHTHAVGDEAMHYTSRVMLAATGDEQTVHVAQTDWVAGEDGPYSWWRPQADSYVVIRRYVPDYSVVGLLPYRDDVPSARAETAIPFVFYMPDGTEQHIVPGEPHHFGPPD